MTSKERAELRTQAMKLDSIFQVGKESVTTQSIDAIRVALKARELIKINVLKNCDDDPAEIGKVLAERTGSELVQVIGRKIVLYKKNMQKEEKRRLVEKREAKKKQNARRKANEQRKVRKWTKEDSLRRKNQKAKEKRQAVGDFR